jgi:hypothetical protein
VAPIGDQGMVSPLSQPAADPQPPAGANDPRLPDADGQIVETTEKSPTQSQADQQTVKDLIARAHKQFTHVSSVESRMRSEMRDDMLFRGAENQWPLALKQLREANGRPCITINRIPQFIRQVVNRSRANKPSIQVNPVDSAADPDTAEILQAICRQTEVNSHADIAYETASDHQATMGRGYIRVTTDWDNDTGFEQTIKILGYDNPLSVYLDPAYSEVTHTPANYGLEIEDVDREEYKARFNKTDADMIGLDAFRSVGDAPPQWVTEETIRIARYWYVTHEPYEIVQISMPWLPDPENPTAQPKPQILTVPRDVLGKQLDAYRADPNGNPQATGIPGVTVLQTRTVNRRKVKVCTINAVEILDGNETKTGGRDWPGSRIPIVPVLGDVVNMDGRVDIRGMVRDGKDPARMYNYWVSAATETIALAPRAPYIGYAGQFKNFETRWEAANSRNFAYLEVNPVTVDGKAAPLPKRSVEEPAIQAIMIALRQADNDLKAVMGLFDPSLGEQGPEESGKAILARQRQGEVANSNFADNLARAVRQVGEIIIDIAPKVYSVPTVLRILGEDGAEPYQAMVHAGQPPDLPKGVVDLDALAKQRGLKGIYDISVGRFDVTISVGPSYQSRRQEAVEAMVQVLNGNPTLMPVIGDIFFGAMDWPGAKGIAKRLARGVPPQFRDPDPGQQEVPPQAQQQLQQQGQQIQQLTQELQQLQLEKQTKAQELAAKGQQAAAEIQSRERIAQQQMETQRQIAELKAISDANNQAAQVRADKQAMVLQAQLDAMQTKLEAMLATRPTRPDPSAGATA